MPSINWRTLTLSDWNNLGENAKAQVRDKIVRALDFSEANTFFDFLFNVFKTVIAGGFVVVGGIVLYEFMKSSSRIWNGRGTREDAEMFDATLDSAGHGTREAVQAGIAHQAQKHKSNPKTSQGAQYLKDREKLKSRGSSPSSTGSNGGEGPSGSGGGAGPSGSGDAGSAPEDAFQMPHIPTGWTDLGWVEGQYLIGKPSSRAGGGFRTKYLGTDLKWHDS